MRGSRTLSPTVVDRCGKVQVTLKLDGGLHLGVWGGTAEHHPQGIAALDVADGERGVVLTNGVGTNHHGTAVGS